MTLNAGFSVAYVVLILDSIVGVKKYGMYPLGGGGSCVWGFFFPFPFYLFKI